MEGAEQWREPAEHLDHREAGNQTGRMKRPAERGSPVGSGQAAQLPSAEKPRLAPGTRTETWRAGARQHVSPDHNSVIARTYS